MMMPHAPVCTFLSPQCITSPCSHLLPGIIKFPLQIRQPSHGFLATLWTMLLNPDLQLLRQDTQELLQHQQLQDLLLSVQLWPEPLIAQLLESAQRLPGPRCLLVAELSELQTKQFLAGSGAPILLKFLTPRTAFFDFHQYQLLFLRILRSWGWNCSGFHSHSGLKELSVKLTKTGSCTSELLWVISSFLKDIKALLTYSDEKKPLRTCNNKDQSLE